MSSITNLNPRDAGLRKHIQAKMNRAQNQALWDAPIKTHLLMLICGEV